MPSINLSTLILVKRLKMLFSPFNAHIEENGTELAARTGCDPSRKNTEEFCPIQPSMVPDSKSQLWSSWPLHVVVQRKIIRGKQQQQQQLENQVRTSSWRDDLKLNMSLNKDLLHYSSSPDFPTRVRLTMCSISSLESNLLPVIHFKIINTQLQLFKRSFWYFEPALSGHRTHSAQCHRPQHIFDEYHLELVVDPLLVYF